MDLIFKNIQVVETISDFVQLHDMPLLMRP